MKRRLLLLPIVALLLSGSGNPDPFPKDYFRSPLGIPLFMAGNFAEMRANHFHSGLDLKTEGREGYRVYAAAEGWVSRIAVSPVGYGNAIYVSHPNGYMTVYGHLSRFNEVIQEYVRSVQYERQRFDVDLFPKRNQFPVDQGQVIALSGNTGGSAGPHLHFEVRDERTGWPVNPLMFGFDIPDTVAPSIYRIKMYAVDDNSSIRIRDARTGGWRKVRAGESVFLEANKSGNSYVLTRARDIEVSGRVGFGIQTHDHQNGSNNLLGTYRIQLKADDTTLSSTLFDRFSFDQTRYINAHVDYAEHRHSGRWVQRGYVLPGNKLPLYETSNKGYLDAVPGHHYTIAYDVEDAYGNTSTLTFRVAGIATEPPAGPMAPAYLRMHNDAPFSYSTANVSVQMPLGTVYDDDIFEYAIRPSRPDGVYSDVHQIHTPDVPAQYPMAIRILANELPAQLRDKALLGIVSDNGAIYSAGGSYENGWVSSESRAFGAYTIVTDTTPPSVRALNVTSGQNLSSTSQIRIRIADDLSGVASYRGEIDGNWVLFEYDSKFNLLKHTFEGTLPSGRHTLHMTVRDQKGNESQLTLPFVR